MEIYFLDWDKASDGYEGERTNVHDVLDYMLPEFRETSEPISARYLSSGSLEDITGFTEKIDDKIELEHSSGYDFGNERKMVALWGASEGIYFIDFDGGFKDVFPGLAGEMDNINQQLTGE